MLPLKWIGRSHFLTALVPWWMYRSTCMHTTGEVSISAVFMPYWFSHESSIDCSAVYPYLEALGSSSTNWTVRGRNASLWSISLAMSLICTRRSHFMLKPPSCRCPKRWEMNSTGSPWLNGFCQYCMTSANHGWVERSNGMSWWCMRQSTIRVAFGPRSVNLKLVRLTITHKVAITAALM